MDLGYSKLFKIAKSIVLFLGIASVSEAEENIIQQGNLSFDKCLNVIESSEDKLSIAPLVTDVSDQERTAVFKLNDGILTITCNREEGTVKVSTNTN